MRARLIPCCWFHCAYYATGQVVIPAPPNLGGRAVAWFCAGHERQWQRALGSNHAWVSYSFGRAPIVGWGIVLP